MAAVTIHSGFRAQEEEICHLFHLFPFYLYEVMGLAFSLSSFTLIKSLLVPLHFLPFSSVAQSCLTLCDPMNCSMSITNSWSSLKLMSFESVMPFNHLILCYPLLLLPSIFPRVFSSELALHSLHRRVKKVA